MIVNTKNKGWEIFSHSAHGLLAGQIANELIEELKDENWVATLAAIIEHDDRQLDFDEKDYLTDLGMPRDFLLEERKVEEIIKRSKRLLVEAERKSTWIAILILHHIQYIYKDMAQDNKSLSSFLETLHTREQSLIKANKLPVKKVKDTYQILVFADRCSLILCQDAIPAMNRKLEINTSIRDTTYFIKEKEDELITIEPWIFRSDNFSVNAEYKVLDQSSFKDNKEFEKCLNECPVRIKKWNFKK
ncbi:DUF3891 family protein [Christiangramia aquimixticola]|uniref:DUF3891 family protein n=1 Tax=Christiangramia aquimixticola TaxID=1697558 RepID=UPI003AA84D93